MTTTVSHTTWGAWPSVRLATPEVELEVVGEIGARVVSLRDLRRAREWLVRGDAPSAEESSAWSSEEAAFWGRESFGWDECLPTVSVCADPRHPAGPVLRDHGDQWGRGAYLSLDSAAGALEHTWNAPRWPYRLSRRLSFTDVRTVLAEYRLVSLASQPLPFLWSQHPVYRLEPDSRIELPGVESVTRTSQLGIDLAEQVSWPVGMAADGRSIDLSRVHTGLGWAAKLYAHARGPANVVAPDGASLMIDWDRAFAPVLGIWLAYGGWPPQGRPYEQVALEPTTSPDDHLEAASSAERARVLSPGERLSWWLTLRLS